MIQKMRIVGEVEARRAEAVMQRMKTSYQSKLLSTSGSRHPKWTSSRALQASQYSGTSGLGIQVHSSVFLQS